MYNTSRLALCLSLLLPLFPSDVQAQSPKKYALLVGINEYDHDKLPKLDYAMNDATKLGDLLKKHGYEVRVLTDKSGDKPTKKNIESALDETLEKFRKGDTVLIGYAGHGLQFGKDCFFCPQDGKPFMDKTQTLVSLTDVYKKLQQSYSGVKLVMVDACRDDGTRGIRGGADDAPQPPKGVGVLLSCLDGEKASESDELKHGVFFYHVIKGLEGAARDPDEAVVTWDSLRSYVKKQVPKDALKLFPNMRKQHPNEIGNLSGVPVLVSLSGEAKVDPKVVVKNDPDTIQFKVVNETFEMKFAKIPGGTFMMGSSKETLALVKQKFDLNEEQKDEDEHEVELSGFQMGKFHVTRGQFEMFVKDDGYKTEAEEGDGGYGWNVETKKFEGLDKKYSWKNAGFSQTDAHPVVNVTWNDAKKFCAWLSQKSGRKVGLPSEAQWEYACRAGSKTLYFFGDDEEDLAAYGNVADSSFRKATEKTYGIKADDGYAFTSPVGTFKANKYGLYDMHGNACQWCEDYYGKYEDVAKRKNPVQTIKQSNDARVLRGGSWSYYSQVCRSADRLYYTPVFRSSNFGFRVVLSP